MMKIEKYKTTDENINITPPTPIAIIFPSFHYFGMPIPLEMKII